MTLKSISPSLPVTNNRSVEPRLVKSDTLRSDMSIGMYGEGGEKRSFNLGVPSVYDTSLATIVSSATTEFYDYNKPMKKARVPVTSDVNKLDTKSLSSKSLVMLEHNQEPNLLLNSFSQTKCTIPANVVSHTKESKEQRRLKIAEILDQAAAFGLEVDSLQKSLPDQNSAINGTISSKTESVAEGGVGNGGTTVPTDGPRRYRAQRRNSFIIHRDRFGFCLGGGSFPLSSAATIQSDNVVPTTSDSSLSVSRLCAQDKCLNSSDVTKHEQASISPYKNVQLSTVDLGEKIRMNDNGSRLTNTSNERKTIDTRESKDVSTQSLKLINTLRSDKLCGISVLTEEVKSYYGYE